MVVTFSGINRLYILTDFILIHRILQEAIVEEK